MRILDTLLFYRLLTRNGSAMIFVILIFLGIVIAAVVLRRAGVGMGDSDSQIDSVYELLEDEAKPSSRGKLVAKMKWLTSIPMPDKTEGCFVILTYEDKKTMKSSMNSYLHCLVGKSSKDEAAAAARHLSGAGSPTIARDISAKRPFVVALLACEDYGMDIEDCERALKRVFNDERLVKTAPAKTKRA